MLSFLKISAAIKPHVAGLHADSRVSLETTVWQDQSRAEIIPENPRLHLLGGSSICLADRAACPQCNCEVSHGAMATHPCGTAGKTRVEALHLHLDRAARLIALQPQLEDRDRDQEKHHRPEEHFRQ